MDKILLDNQLTDLLDMTENQAQTTHSIQTICPLERLLKTKPIWFLLDVTREESSKILHNKKPGNFIIRGSREPKTLVISVKLGRSHGCQVQHFIIILREGKFGLEESDLNFENILSLVFHYSNVCDELPEKLSLPELLSATGSVRYLVTLSLLGKSFWSYPVARSDRMSLLGMDNESYNLNSQLNVKTQSSHLPTREDKLPKYLHQSDHRRDLSTYEKPGQCLDKTKVIRTPLKPERRFSSGTVMPSPPAKHNVRRKSDFVPFITVPARSPRVKRNSLGSLYSARHPDTCAQECQEWVTSPVFSADQLGQSRGRKLSVFDGSLGCVQEVSEHDNGDREAVYEDISEKYLSTGDNHSNDLCYNDEDYAYPVDAVNEDTEHNIYEDPTYYIDRVQSDDKKAAPDTVISSMNQRLSDSHMRYGVDATNMSDGQGDNLRGATWNINRRKLSLGVILRKLSTGSMQGRDRQTSLQERGLSTAFAKLINFPICGRKSLGESYQVDSSSWEFLNRDVEDDCWDKKVDTSDKHRDNDEITEHRQFTNHKHPSKDSLYESEYDSSCTMESIASSSSRTSRTPPSHNCSELIIPL